MRTFDDIVIEQMTSREGSMTDVCTASDMEGISGSSLTNVCTASDMEGISGSSFWDRLALPVYRRKVFHTALVYLANFAWGWMVAIKGPSLMDLQRIAQTDTTGGASFFTSAAVGGVVGAVVGGAIYDRFNTHMTTFLSMLLYAGTCVVIPYCDSYWLMVVMFFIHETMIGGFKTGGNVDILNIWGDHSKTWMQGLHFFFSLGATASPLVLAFFLPSGNHDYDSNGNGTRHNDTISLLTNTSTPVEVDVEIANTRKAYIVSGLVGGVAALGLLIRYLHDRKSGPVTRVCKEKATVSRKTFPRSMAICTLVLFFLLYFFLDEVEDSSALFLATFVKLSLGWRKINGAHLTSTFWGAFTCGRLIGVVSVSFLTHFQFFSVCSCALVCAQVGLLLSALFHYNVGVWVSVALMGMSISVVFPASLTWMEKEFVAVSGKILSVIYVALSVGGMVNPQLIGYTMQHVTYLSYCYVLITETVLFCIVLASLKLFLSTCLTRYKRQADQVDQSVKYIGLNHAEDRNENKV